MAAETERDIGEDLMARAEALSPRRLMLLTGAFIAALAILVFLQLRQEMETRRTETSLRVALAANECAGAINVAIMTGGPVRQALAICHPGGRAALYHLSAKGDVITAYGATGEVNLDPASAQALTLSARGDGMLELSTGRAVAAWRPLDNGEAMFVAAPVGDLFQRTPVWMGYALILAAIALVIASLMAAFLRQSRTALEAASAVDTLRHYADALAGGRCSPWFYDGKARTVTLARTLLEPLGLGARDRVFTLREMSALIHQQDLRIALAVLTGDASGVSEAIVRMREPGGAW
ncbi:MAG: hypothetical protein WD076_09165, partial [Parvularculaceae bacterium]